MSELTGAKPEFPDSLVHGCGMPSAGEPTEVPAGDGQLSMVQQEVTTKSRSQLLHSLHSLLVPLVPLTPTVPLVPVVPLEACSTRGTRSTRP